MSSLIPFIGRSRELEQLSRAITDWNSTRAIAIRGAGGIGKTRLISEAHRMAKEAERDQKKLSIAVVQEFTSSAWSTEFIEGATSMAKDLGVAITFTDANFDLGQMARDLTDVVERKPDAIIVSLGTDDRVAASMGSAIEAQIPVVTIDNRLSGVSVTCRISQDDHGGALQVLEALASDLDYQGAIAVVWTPGEAEQTHRREMLNLFLRKYPDITVAAELGHMGSNAAEYVKDETKRLMVDRQEIRAIWTVFNEYARGVTEALIEIGRTDVYVYGFDYCPVDYEVMSSPYSPWRATVGTNPREVGRAGVRIATLAALGNFEDIKRQYRLPMSLIRQPNLPTVNEASGQPWGAIGIGWTSQLHIMEAIEKDTKVRPFRVPETIDFDDSTLDVGVNLEVRLARTLDPKQGTEFWDVLMSLRRLQAGSARADAIEKEIAILRSVLVKCLNESAARVRTIVVFDTVEKMSDSTARNVASIVGELKNTLCVFAGRPKESIIPSEGVDVWSILEELGVPSLELIELCPFDAQMSSDYLFAKQRHLHFVMDGTVRERLAILSGGRPILLDLAVEYVARSLSIESLLEIRPATLLVLSDDERERVQLQFERGLVRHLTQMSSPLDQLILVMSRVYPLTPRMIEGLLDVSSEVARHLDVEVRRLAFVKILPYDQGVSLHDEMRRLVDMHVWETIDDDQTQRCSDSAIAADLYTEMQVQLLRDLADLKQSRSDSRVGGSDDVQMRVEDLEVRLDQITEQKVYHALYADFEANLATLFDEVDRVRDEKKHELAERLLRLVETSRQEIRGRLRVYYELRRARLDLDRGSKLEPIRQRLLALLKDDDLSAQDRARIINQVAVAETRLGYWEDARDRQEEVRMLIDAGDQFAVALVENQLGYIYRLMDDFSLENLDHARDHYVAAFEAATSYLDGLDPEGEPALQSRNLIAGILNNLGYIYVLKHEYESARVYCERAIDIWTRIGRPREIARAETSLGILERDRGVLSTAREHLVSAILRLRDPEDYEQLCRAKFHLGWTYFFEAVSADLSHDDMVDRLLSARKALEAARDLADRHNVAIELPGILHWLSRVLWEIGIVRHDLASQAKAREVVSRSIELSETRTGSGRPVNVHYAIEGLVAGAQFAQSSEGLAGVEEYESRLVEGYGEYKDAFPLCFGRMKRIRADAAFDAGSYERALEAYIDGFRLINRHGGYGPHKISLELSRLVVRMAVLDEVDRRNWFNVLADRWVNEPAPDQNGVNLSSWARQQALLARVHRG